MVVLNDYEAQWVAEAVGGDANALRLLLAFSRPEVRAYIARHIPADLMPICDPDDIVQDAYASVFRRIGSFQPRDPRAFRRWVLTIALNRLRNVIRDERSEKRGGERVVRVQPGNDQSSVILLKTLVGTGDTPSRCMASGEAVQAVKAALAELPEDYRQAVSMVHLEGCSVAETAERMGRTKRAINGLCRRGLRRMQDQLQNPSRFFSSRG